MKGSHSLVFGSSVFQRYLFFLICRLFFWSDCYNVTLYYFLEFSFGVTTVTFRYLDIYYVWYVGFFITVVVDRTIPYMWECLRMCLFRINFLSYGYIHTCTWTEISVFEKLCSASCFKEGVVDRTAYWKDSVWSWCWGREVHSGGFSVNILGQRGC